MKNCIICKENKSLTEYYNHSGMKDGKLGKCKSCMKECNSVYRSSNQESVKEYYEKNKSKRQQQGIQYYKENREEILEKKQNDSLRKEFFPKDI